MASGQFKLQHNCNCLKFVNRSGMWSVSEPDLKDVGRRYNGIREANEIYCESVTSWTDKSLECGRLSARLEKSKMLEGGIMVSETQVRFNVNF